MKKIFAFMIATSIFLSMGVSAFAKETISEENGSKDIDVQAKTVYNLPENMFTDVIENGKGTVISNAGINISVMSNNGTLDNLTLNVIEIVKSDTEAYAWMSKVMKNTADEFIAYDIYFTDIKGNHIDIKENVTLSVSKPIGYLSSSVYCVDKSEKLKKIDSKLNGSNIEFVASDFSYYVIANKGNDNTGDITKPVQPNDPDSVDTSDHTNTFGWFLTILFASTTIVVIRTRKEKIAK